MIPNVHIFAEKEKSEKKSLHEDKIHDTWRLAFIPYICYTISWFWCYIIGYTPYVWLFHSLTRFH